MNRKSIFILSTIFLLISAGQFLIMNQKLLKTRRTLSKRIKAYRRAHRVSQLSINNKRTLSLPAELANVPYLDGGVICDVKEIEVRNVFAPYNASIIEKGDDQYLLFFRYDIVRQMHFMNYDANIGCIELDEYFDQTKNEYIHIDTLSPQSEDPRVIKNEDDYYLVYNDSSHFSFKDRKMHISRINSETFQPEVITKMDPHLAATEKNWVPFIHQNHIHFEYQVFTPRKILRLDDPTKPTLAHIHDPPSVENYEWENRWGKPLGGSSARLVDGQYLAFFHSKFKDKMGIYWYVMGAYTFEAEPPFKMTAVSKQPLLFKGIYETEALNTSDPHKFVIFPGGYAIKEYGDKTLFHLACGENDSAIKIVTIDKDKLLESLHTLKK